MNWPRLCGGVQGFTLRRQARKLPAARTIWGMIRMGEQPYRRAAAGVPLLQA